MSLYSLEEICEGCLYARWHSCDKCYGGGKRFCHCMMDSESQTDSIRGRCEDKTKVFAEQEAK